MEHNNNAPHGQQNLHDQIARKYHVRVELVKAEAKGKTPSPRMIRQIVQQMPPMLPVISEEDEFSDIEKDGSTVVKPKNQSMLPVISEEDEFSDIEKDGNIAVEPKKTLKPLHTEALENNLLEGLLHH